MTTSSQTLTRALPAVAAPAPVDARPVDRLMAAVAEVTCQLRGHEPELQLSEDRIWLFCPSCRRRSAGWQLDLPRPRVRQHGDPERFSRYTWLTGRVDPQPTH